MTQVNTFAVEKTDFIWDQAIYVCVYTLIHTYQLSGSHLVENLLCILAVMAALHDGQEELRSIVLQHKKGFTDEP